MPDLFGLPIRNQILSDVTVTAAVAFDSLAIPHSRPRLGTATLNATLGTLLTQLTLLGVELVEIVEARRRWRLEHGNRSIGLVAQNRLGRDQGPGAVLNGIEFTLAEFSIQFAVAHVENGLGLFSWELP
jgi:hypothetical protein